MNAPIGKIPSPATRLEYDDEIDIAELIVTLWQGRWLLITCVLVCIGLALAYVNSTTKIYKIDATIHPTSDSQLNLVSPGFSQYKQNYKVATLEAGNLFDLTLNDLQTESTIGNFLLKNSGQYGGFFDDSTNHLEKVNSFYNKLQISQDKQNMVATVSLSGSTPEIIAKLLHDYLVFVNRNTIDRSIQELINSINNHIGYIDKSIIKARARARDRINNKITDLEEAIKIAQTLDMEQSTFNELNVEPEVFKGRLYLLGTKALTAELAILKQSEQSDSTVPELRQLQAAKNALQIDAEKIKQNAPDVNAVAIPASLYPPLDPDSPKTLLILVASIAFGIIIGSIAILVRHAMNAYKYRHNGNQEVDLQKI